MTEPRTQQWVADVEAFPGEARVEEDELTSEMLVEEVSIDGMCGVY